MREKALIELPKAGLGAVGMVLLGKSYRVGKWLLDGYIELVKREATISDEDVAAIGNYATIQLLRMREKRLKTSEAGFGRGLYEDVEKRVREIFSKELVEAGCDLPVTRPRYHNGKWYD